jgi:predicted glycosyltransferase
LLSAILDFQPDLVLVDKKPFGVGNELVPAFELLRRRHLRPRIVLVLRDILDSPEATKSVWRKNEYFEAIQSFYDEVLVAGSREVFDITKEYDFPPQASAKVTFCGYLRRSHVTRTREQQRAGLGLGASEPLVLVTTGGGEDGFRLVSAYLSGLGETHCAHQSLVVCGPEMGAAERREVARLAEPHPRVTVASFTGEMMNLMNAADLVVCMGGYNTTCELLSLRKRAVMVPRTQPVQEQWIRAERLHRLGIFRTLHPDQLTPQTLMRAVEEELGRSNVYPQGLYQIDLDGLPCIARRIQAQLAHETTPLHRARHQLEA